VLKKAKVFLVLFSKKNIDWDQSGRSSGRHGMNSLVKASSTNTAGASAIAVR
jgi:hypothetical protein